MIPAQVGAKSDKGPVRPANEDAYWTAGIDEPTELGALYIVADGVGGQEHGKVASQEAVRVISDLFYQRRAQGVAVPAALSEAVHTANLAIFALAQEQGISKMGCTVVAAVQHEGTLTIAHVGDARAYILAGGELHRLTRDDSWVQRQIEAGVITPAQAANHEYRNVVTQVLGNKEVIDVHLAAPLPLYSGDTFMLCSDGVHDPIPHEEISRLLQQNPPQQAAEALVKTAIFQGTEDNVTAVVVNCGTIPGRTRVAASAGSFWQNLPVPTWVPITVAAVILLLIVVFVVVPLFSNGEVADGENGAATPLPTILPVATLPAVATAVPEVILATEVPTSLPAETAVPTDTPAVVATDTPTAAPSSNPLPPPTETLAPEPPPQLACINGDPFLWTDAQIDSDSCDNFARNYWSDETSDPEILLIAPPRTANGPDNACEPNSFVKVQSVSDPTVIGWVLELSVLNLPPGGSCR